MHGFTPEEPFEVENYIETRDFIIYKGNNFYNILIGKMMDKVIIRSLHYSSSIDLLSFEQSIKVKLSSIDELFNIITNSFSNNMVTINNIKTNKEMKLFMSFNYNNKPQKIDLTLIYSKINTEHIINNLWSKLMIMEKSLNEIKGENNQLKEENQRLKQQIKGSLNPITEINNNNNNNYNNFQNQNMMNFNLNNNMNFNNFNNSINNNFNMNSKTTIFNNSNTLSLLFKESGGNRNIISIDGCLPTDKVSDLMNKYKSKINDNGLNFYFTYNAKVLNPNVTLAQAGIMNLVTISVMRGKAPISY